MASNQPTQSVATQTVQNYSFPRNRLRLTQRDPTKTPLVLVACGSFSPITYLHMRMFVMAADFVRFNTQFELMGGYLSPVADSYKKVGLVAAEHRLRMCELAVQQDSNWLMVDPWEAIQPDYMPTALVLDHFDHEINEVLGGAERPDGTRVPVKISLLAGADLIGTMSTPGVWSEEDLDHILRRYGTFIVERSGTDMEEALAHLQTWRDQIYVIPQLLQNDISSTKIRLFLKRGLSVQYLIPAPVVEYIEQNGLFEQHGPHEDDGTSSVNEKGKSKSAEGSSQESSAVADSGSKS